MSATTTYLSLPYPTATDDPRQAPAQMQALATALDSVANSWTDYSTFTIPGYTRSNGTLYSRYQKMGKTIHWVGCLTIGSSDTLPQVPRFPFPFPPVISAVVGQGYVSGNSADTEDFRCAATTYPGGTHLGLIGAAVGSAASSSWVGWTAPWSDHLKAGDQLAWTITYECT